MGCTALSHSLHEDAQLLQAHVCPGPHADDADAQALRVCGAEGSEMLGGHGEGGTRRSSSGLAGDNVRDAPHPQPSLWGMAPPTLGSVPQLRKGCSFVHPVFAKPTRMLLGHSLPSVHPQNGWAAGPAEGDPRGRARGHCVCTRGCVGDADGVWWQQWAHSSLSNLIHTHSFKDFPLFSPSCTAPPMGL